MGESKSSKTNLFAGREMMRALTKKWPRRCREGARFEDMKLTELDQSETEAKRELRRVKNVPMFLASQHMAVSFPETAVPKPSATNGLGVWS